MDVLVVGSGHAALAAKAASRTTPVVFVDVGNPVGKGLVASLARPGGNLTGLAWDAGPELAAKWLEHVREAVPGALRVATLTDEPPDPGFRAAMDSAARQLKLELHRFYARRPEDFAGAFAAIEQARVDALYWCLSSPDKPVLDFVARRRLPAVGCWRGAVAAGALMSYAPSLFDLYRRAAVYIDKIRRAPSQPTSPSSSPRSSS